MNKFDTLCTQIFQENIADSQFRFIEEASGHIARQLVALIMSMKEQLPPGLTPPFIKNPHQFNGQLNQLAEDLYDNLLSQKTFQSDLRSFGISPHAAQSLRYQIVPRAIDIVNQTGILAPSEGGQHFSGKNA